MRVDPAIAAMRGDRSPQLRAQAAMFAARDAWRRRARVAPVLAELEALAGGAPLTGCAAVTALFEEDGAAADLAGSLCSAFAAALAGEPFGQLPFRHGFDGVHSTLLLARFGPVRLSLVAQEPGEFEAPSVTFSDAVRHDAVIAGEATARLIARSPDGSFESEPRSLADGARLEIDLSHEALSIERVERRLVSLRLHRGTRRPRPVREYSLPDGRLLAQSAGDMRDSRQEMMLALLGRMKRAEAAPLMAEIAAEPRPDTLRWEALREALALDTATGFAALCGIARSPVDPLAIAAGALRAQLVEAHPQLLAFEEAQCRA